jgi:hypothetical protein
MNHVKMAMFFPSSFDCERHPQADNKILREEKPPLVSQCRSGPGENNVDIVCNTVFTVTHRRDRTGRYRFDARRIQPVCDESRNFR